MYSTVHFKIEGLIVSHPKERFHGHGSQSLTKPRHLCVALKPTLKAMLRVYDTVRNHLEPSERALSDAIAAEDRATDIGVTVTTKAEFIIPDGCMCDVLPVEGPIPVSAPVVSTDSWQRREHVRKISIVVTLLS